MKNIKKVLSVVLAVVMAFSAVSLVAFAHTYTPGTEVSTSTNVKLEVAQVASVSSGANTVTAVNNDLYAVTVYAKAVEGQGLAIIWVPIKFDASKFAILMDYTGAYSYADFYYDNYFTNSDVYTLPARYSDTQMYNAQDGVVTAARDAVAIGLGYTGNPKPGTISFEAIAEIEGTDGYEAFDTTPGSGMDVLLCTLKLSLGSTNVKSSYLNTVKGHLVCDDYLEMFTVYFKRLCTEAEAENAYFGVETGSDMGTQCSKYPAGTNPGYNKQVIEAGQINYVANAVETPVKALCGITAAAGAKSQQIMFNLDANATPTYTKDDITSVDYRFVAQFSTTNFPIEYEDPNGTGNGRITNTQIAEIGFVMAKTSAVSNPEDLKTNYNTAAAIASLSKTEGDVRKCWTAKISTDMAGDASFAFSCRIQGIGVTYVDDTVGYTASSEYYAVPYVVSKSGAVSWGPVMTSNVAGRCNTYAGNYLAAVNA